MKTLTFTLGAIFVFQLCLLAAVGQQVNHTMGAPFQVEQELWALNASADVSGDGLGDIVYALGDFVVLLDFSTSGFRSYQGFAEVASIGLLGDVDGDGFGDLIFGQPFEQNSFGGIVTVVSGDTQETLYSVSPTPGGDSFGQSVIGLGDTNGDGVPDFAAAAPFGDAPYVGVYSGIDGSPLLTIPSLNQSAFGQALANAGDVDGDGVADILIGAPYGNTGGAVYIVSSVSGESLNFVESGPDSFGASVANAGDVNADGYSDFIIGAPDEGDGSVVVLSGADGSSLYLFTNDSTTHANVTSSFGFSVSGTGDINGDGHTDVIVGAVGGFGSATVFSGANGAILYEQRGSGRDSDSFGQYVSGGADLSGDGFPDFLIGSSEGAIDDGEGYFQLFESSVIGALIGDFNLDGDVDAEDIDFYGGNLGNPALGNLRLKLADDELPVYTLADHDTLIREFVQTSNGQTGAIVGDINLDGTVDVLGDAFILIGNLGSNAVSGYANGDLNADQRIDILGDAFRLVANLGRSTDGRTHGGIL